jgi:hypothetical protein
LLHLRLRVVHSRKQLARRSEPQRRARSCSCRFSRCFRCFLRCCPLPSVCPAPPPPPNGKAARPVTASPHRAGARVANHSSAAASTPTGAPPLTPTSASPAGRFSWVATSPRCSCAALASTLPARSFVAAAAAVAPAPNASCSPGASCPEPSAAASLASYGSWSPGAPCAEQSAAAAITAEASVCFKSTFGPFTAGSALSGAPGPEDAFAAAAAAPATAVAAACAATRFRAPAPRCHYPAERQRASVTASPSRAGARVANSASAAASTPTAPPAACAHQRPVGRPLIWGRHATAFLLRCLLGILPFRSFVAAAASVPAPSASCSLGVFYPGLSAAASLASDACCSPDAPIAKLFAAAATSTVEAPVRCTAGPPGTSYTEPSAAASPPSNASWSPGAPFEFPAAAANLSAYCRVTAPPSRPA